MTEKNTRELLEKAGFEIHENKYHDQVTGETKTNYYVFVRGERIPADTISNLAISLGLVTRVPETIKKPEVLDNALSDFTRRDKTPVSRDRSLVLEYAGKIYVALRNDSGTGVAAYIARGVDNLSKIDRLPWEHKS